MRLIDADKLSPTDKVVIIKPTGEKCVYQRTDNASTVNAIPIEWINSYTTGLIFSDDYVDNADSIDDYIYCIDEMVRDWEKENDR